MPIAGGLDEASEGLNLSRMLQAQAIGRGRSKDWRGDGVRLGWTTDTACFATTPNRLSAVVDGTIHNLTDLNSTLGLRPSTNAAELILSAYNRWGLEFLNRLAGEFSLALWDGRTRKLCLARDAVGCAPLHYWKCGKRVLFAGEPRGLLVDEAVPRELDEVRIATYMALLPDNDNRSFYRDIYRVQPGHVVIISTDGDIAEHRYWRPEEIAPLRLKHDAEYEEALRHTLDIAIDCRMPKHLKIATELSSGLDSSSMVVMAAKQLARQGRRLTAVTASPTSDFQPSLTENPRYDESAAAAQIAAQYSNVDHVIVRPDGPQQIMPHCDMFSAMAGYPLRGVAHACWWDEIYKEVVRRGCKVLLSGELGNLGFSSAGTLTLSSHVRHGRITAFLRETHARRKLGRSWKNIAWEAVGPLLPDTLHRVAVRLKKGTLFNVYDYNPLNPSLARSVAIEDRIHDRQTMFSRLVGGDSRLWRLNGMRLVDRGLFRTSVRRQYGIEVTAPLADRRMMDLAFSIPDDQYYKNGEDRSLIRRAMAGLLPADILSLTGRGHQGADWHIHMTASLPDCLSEMERLEKSPMAQHCLDLPRMRKALDNWPMDPSSASDEGLRECRIIVGRGLAVGRFIRSFEMTNQ